MPPPIRDSIVRPRRRKLGEFIKPERNRMELLFGAIAIMIGLAGVGALAKFFMAVAS